MNRECITIYGSQRLIELLSRINHKIARSILDEFYNRNSHTISYLDLGETNNTVSFIYSNKVQELRQEFDFKFKEMAWTQKRSDIKIGKLIKMLFGDDSFPVNQPKDKPVPSIPNDIESFTNMYIAERDKNENHDRFEIVEGQELIDWYNYKNYSRFTSEDTPLGKSCLRYDESASFLDMYRTNPDKIKMLILKDDKNKLRARAILWKLDTPENRMYMDRVYTINDYDVQLFKSYATKQGWLYKERQTFGWNNVIVDIRNETLNTPNNLILSVKLTNKNFNYYPYLDTLAVYNKLTGVLSNDGKLLKFTPHLHLIDPRGGYINEADDRERVRSIYYGDNILREDATYCEIDDDWVYESDSVYVHNTGGRKAVRGSRHIVKSVIKDKVKYFLSSESVYSDYLGTYIYKDSVREVYLDDNKTSKVIIHFKQIKDFCVKNGNDYILKKDLVNKHNDLKIGTSNQRSFVTVDENPISLDNGGNIFGALSPETSDGQVMNGINDQVRSIRRISRRLRGDGESIHGQVTPRLSLRDEPTPQLWGTTPVDDNQSPRPLRINEPDESRGGYYNNVDYLQTIRENWGSTRDFFWLDTENNDTTEPDTREPDTNTEPNTNIDLS